MPWSVDRTGRVQISTPEKDADLYLRVVKYPWFNLVEGMRAGGDALNRGDTAPLRNVLDEFLSEGPLLAGLDTARGVGDRWQTYKRASIRYAESVIKPFIPYFRITEGMRAVTAAKEGEPKQYPATFMEAIGQALPLPVELTGLQPTGKLKTDAEGNLVIANPTLEQLKFWIGVNLKEINPDDYEAEKNKIIENALRAIDKADNIERLMSAADRLRSADPELHASLKKTIEETRILITKEQAEQVRRARVGALPVEAPAGQEDERKAEERKRKIEELLEMLK